MASPAVPYASSGSSPRRGRCVSGGHLADEEAGGAAAGMVCLRLAARHNLAQALVPPHALPRGSKHSRHATNSSKNAKHKTEFVFYADKSVQHRIARSTGVKDLLDLCRKAVSDQDMRELQRRLRPEGYQLHRRNIGASHCLFVLFESHPGLPHWKDVYLLRFLIDSFHCRLGAQREKQLHELRKAGDLLGELCRSQHVPAAEARRVRELQVRLRNSCASVTGSCAPRCNVLFPKGAKLEALFVDDGVFVVNGVRYLQAVSLSEEEYLRLYNLTTPM